MSMTEALQFLLLVFAGWVNREQQKMIEYLRAENHVLKCRLGKRRIRFTDAERRALGRKAKAVGRRALRELGCIVSPDTLLRWHRQLVAKKYDGTAHRAPSKRGIQADVEQLIVRMALDNGSWGYSRIQGALKNVGHQVGRSTIRRVLAKHGIEPAPGRRRGMPWKTFLKAHWSGLVAMDFFSVEALTPVGLIRYLVLFAIDVPTRRIEICGIRHRPTGAWMQQIGRNLTAFDDGFLIGKKIVLHDRDPLFTEAFRQLLRDEGVEPIRLPAKSSNLNAFAERFVLSVKSECLNKIVILGEAHLRTVISEYSAHYHLERNHQSLGNELLTSQTGPAANDEPIVCDERLGGILKVYRRAA